MIIYNSENHDLTLKRFVHFPDGLASGIYDPLEKDCRNSVRSRSTKLHKIIKNERLQTPVLSRKK